MTKATLMVVEDEVLVARNIKSRLILTAYVWKSLWTLIIGLIRLNLAPKDDIR